MLDSYQEGFSEGYDAGSVSGITNLLTEDEIEELARLKEEGESDTECLIRVVKRGISGARSARLSRQGNERRKRERIERRTTRLR